MSYSRSSHDLRRESGSGFEGESSSHKSSKEFGNKDITTGAVFALACLKRASPGVEAGGFWRELASTLGTGGGSSSYASMEQGSSVVAVGDATLLMPPQPLRTWALHALTIVARTLSLRVSDQARVRSTLSHMTALLETHFLSPWSSPGPVGSLHEPALLVSLVRLANAMIPIVQTVLDPGQALVSRFFAICFGIVDILPRGYCDSRVTKEVLHTAELLAGLPLLSHSEEERAAYQTALLRMVVDLLRSPLAASPACTAAAAGMLRSFARQVSYKQQRNGNKMNVKKQPLSETLPFF